MRVAVAIHDQPVWTIPDSHVDRLRRAMPDDDIVHARTFAERASALAGADIAFATKVTAEEFAGATRLQWVHSSAVGVGPILSPALVASRVVVSSSRGVHSPAIAEHAIALILALRRQIHTSVRRQVVEDWAQIELSTIPIPPLASLNLLVVGLGSIGERVAAMAASLGMRVTAVRRQVSEPKPPGVAEVVSADRLADALPAADVVVLAVPQTDETRALVGRTELARMKPTAILVNVARGRLVDEDALADALERGELGAAGLDAFRVEPLPAGHRLWRLPNVLITPHSASFAGDYWTPVVDLFLENVARFRRGDPLINVVDKTRGY
ncbi:MAG TPA: D-2-hydroxyacid dehydrogenase [Vicinamibacterales bacterium]|nr:D-2-hydroxyacid dehydrogenase [Vicinamibacterales bacterium]